MAWLTPAMDRLFIESASGRRRFLDRLVLGFEPGHARAHACAMRHAMRERARLLKFGPRDPAWLDGLEAEMAETGIALRQPRGDRRTSQPRAGGARRSSRRVSLRATGARTAKPIRWPNQANPRSGRIPRISLAARASAMRRRAHDLRAASVRSFVRHTEKRMPTRAIARRASRRRF
jgi:hypothetical protein